MSYEIDIVTEEELRREKEKARSLRRTHWWNRKIQGGLCYYCHREVGREQLTMDHVVPLSRGGKSKKGNIVPACKECNNKKKSMLPIEWEEYLRTLDMNSGNI
jgi:5-methylcytosine-specific restriction endonuclease McrA